MAGRAAHRGLNGPWTLALDAGLQAAAEPQVLQPQRQRLPAFGHPLTQRRAPLRFDDLLAYPFATTPLSDEIGRLLVERYGPQAHLEQCVTLRSEEIAALVAVAEVTDTVVLTTRPAAPALVELELQPPLEANARFAFVTLAGRPEPPLLPLLKGLIVGCLKA